MRAYLLGGLVAVAMMLTAGTAVAHHSFAAEFDANKPIKLTGKVTKVEWTNPHVWFYFNVKDEKTGEVTNWGAEMGPPHLPAAPRLAPRHAEDRRGNHGERIAGQERQQADERETGRDDGDRRTTR